MSLRINEHHTRFQLECSGVEPLDGRNRFGILLTLVQENQGDFLGLTSLSTYEVSENITTAALHGGAHREAA